MGHELLRHAVGNHNDGQLTIRSGAVENKKGEKECMKKMRRDIPEAKYMAACIDARFVQHIQADGASKVVHRPHVLKKKKKRKKKEVSEVSGDSVRP